jgi:hypothetical protein
MFQATLRRFNTRQLQDDALPEPLTRVLALALGELDAAQLALLVGGAATSGAGASGPKENAGCPVWQCGTNHNQTLVRAAELA